MSKRIINIPEYEYVQYININSHFDSDSPLIITRKLFHIKPTVFFYFLFSFSTITNNIYTKCLYFRISFYLYILSALFHVRIHCSHCTVSVLVHNAYVIFNNVDYRTDMHLSSELNFMSSFNSFFSIAVHFSVPLLSAFFVCLSL